jgi:hypothetical protein
MGEKRGPYRVVVGNLRERHQVKGVGINGWKMLKWALK